MPTKFLCPKAGCGKASTGSESLIGKSVRYKHCGYLFVAQATLEARAGETQAREKSRSSQSLSAIPLASSTASIGRGKPRPDHAPRAKE